MEGQAITAADDFLFDENGEKLELTQEEQEEEEEGDEEDDDDDEEGEETLERQISHVRHENEILLAEIDMLQGFIGRLDPQDLAVHVVKDAPRVVSEPVEDVKFLTLEQKLYIAQREVTEIQQDREKLKKNFERIIDNYKAIMLEAELRHEEIKKARFEFETKSIKAIKSKISEKKDPEIILRYIKDTSKVTHLEKFHLKNNALMFQEKKLRQQLKMKKEMGKTHYEVQILEFTDPRVDLNLDAIQKNCFKVKCALNANMEKLQRVTEETEELIEEIGKKNQKLAEIEEGIQIAENDRLKVEASNKRLRWQLGKYQVPDISDYMEAKKKHKRLQKDIDNLEKKVEIAQIGLKNCAKEWRKQEGALTSLPGSEFGASSEKNDNSTLVPNVGPNSPEKNEVRTSSGE